MDLIAAVPEENFTFISLNKKERRVAAETHFTNFVRLQKRQQRV